MLVILQLAISLSTCVTEDLIEKEYGTDDEVDFSLTNTAFAYIYYTDATCTIKEKRSNKPLISVILTLLMLHVLIIEK